MPRRLIALWVRDNRQAKLNDIVDAETSNVVDAGLEARRSQFGGRHQVFTKDG